MVTVRELISALGGPKAVAEHCAVSAQAVTNWQSRDHIPARHHLTLWRLAQQHRVTWRPPNADGLALRPDRTPLSIPAEAA